MQHGRHRLQRSAVLGRHRLRIDRVVQQDSDDTGLRRERAERTTMQRRRRVRAGQMRRRLLLQRSVHLAVRSVQRAHARRHVLASHGRASGHAARVYRHRFVRGRLQDFAHCVHFSDDPMLGRIMLEQRRDIRRSL